MALPQANPERGRNRHVHFRYVGTSNGSTWTGWLAGVPHWYLCHTKGKTKPCLHEMTSGAVNCPRCTETKEPEMIAYVPIYREVDCSPVMVIIHGEQRERAEQLSLHQRIVIGREKDQADGVWLSPALKRTPEFQTTLEERRRPADLTETLLRLWQLPDLVTWYRSQPTAAPEHEVEVKPVRAEPPVDRDRVERVNRDFARAVVAARGKHPPLDEEPATLGMVIPAVPIPNGKHHKSSR